MSDTERKRRGPKPRMKLESRFYTLQDVADILATSYRMVSEEINAGRLPALKIGKEYRIPRDGFEVWVADMTAQIAKRATEPRLEVWPKYKSGRKAKARTA